MIGLEEVPCALCGSKRSRVLFDRPYSAEPQADLGALAASTDLFRDYGRIVRCRDCGLVFTNPRPGAEALLKGYGGTEDAGYLAESSSRSINAHLSLNTIKRHKASGRLLDVGASTGYFLNAARVNFDVSGIEPSRWACAIARERFKLDIVCGALETASLEPASFDVVSMIDVIEHLTRPKEAVAAAARLLKPGGILYLVTPAIDSLSARVLGGHWWGLRPAHIYYFSRATLSRLLEEAGLEPVQVKSFGRIFTYGYWASRLSNYPGFVHRPVSAAIRMLGIEDKLVYLDTRDSVEVCARKR